MMSLNSPFSPAPGGAGRCGRLLFLLLTLALIGCSSGSPTPTAATTQPEPSDTAAAEAGSIAQVEATAVLPAASRPLSTPTGPVTALNRPADPVVLTGADVPGLLGIAPGRLTAWRFGADGWQQIPVQVDERATFNMADFNNQPGEPAPVFLFYTDPEIRPDPDPNLDEDDEIAFLASEAGLLPPSYAPPDGVTAASGVRLIITDPLDEGVTAYVYLFEGDSPAGQRYVAYSAGLEGEVETAEGLNVEDSTVTTPYYSHHFSARWVLDELHLTAGSSPTEDILDRFRMQLGPDDCERSEGTFSTGQGYFLVNISGPVRAIRAYVGANSGRYTQRLHIFYPQRHDMTTFVRVHALIGLMDLLDWNENAAGMTYANNLNLDGVTINGQPDQVAEGILQWELYGGDQGSLVVATQVETDMPDLNVTSFYQDEANPARRPCGGDEQAYGVAGVWLREVACTDPARAAVDQRHCPIVHNLAIRRTFYYEAPNLVARAAEQRYNQAQTPLQVTAEPAG